MGTEHTFYDYVDANGRNTIHAWLNSIPLPVKGKLNKWLLHLEGTPQGKWTRPLVETLTDRACDNLFEVRAKLGTQQYRILGCHGPGRGTPTLLWGFIKPGGPVPQTDCRSAQRIRALIESEPEQYREGHNYG
jgi:hypothetical protein